MVVILDKRDFFKRFCDLKLNDLAILMREEIAYKVDTTEWPIIPTSFREYEEID